jgi:hypothetical protein
MSWAVGFLLRLFLIAIGAWFIFTGVSVICQHVGFEKEAARCVAAAIAGGLGFLALAVALGRRNSQRPAAFLGGVVVGHLRRLSIF